MKRTVSLLLAMLLVLALCACSSSGGAGGYERPTPSDGKADGSKEQTDANEPERLLYQTVEANIGTNVDTITQYEYDADGNRTSGRVISYWRATSVVKDDYEIFYYDSADDNVVAYMKDDRMTYDIFTDDGIYLYTSYIDPARQVILEERDERDSASGQGEVITVKQMSDGKTVTFVATYNAEGELIRYEGRDSFIHEYENGNLIRHYVYNYSLSTEPLLYHTYEYGAHGQKVRETRYGTEWQINGSTRRTGELGYAPNDPNCRLIEEKTLLYSYAYVTLEEYVERFMDRPDSGIGSVASGASSSGAVECFHCGTLGAPKGKTVCSGCDDGRVFSKYDSSGRPVTRSCAVCSGSGYRTCVICQGDGYIRD